MPTAVHVACRPARFWLVEAGDEHVAEPLRSPASGSSVPSAPGARRRIARCAIEEQPEHLHEERPDVRGERRGPAERAQGVGPEMISAAKTRSASSVRRRCIRA